MSEIIVELPCIIKAVSPGADGKRMVQCEASNEAVDGEGDVVLQRALLDSADSFVATGHLDIDHLSEIGDRLGIQNPTAYIVGRPTEVKDLGKGRTGIVGEIRKSADGKHDPDRNRYDSFWDSLHSDPPVKWRASIYGFPIKGMVDDCRKMACDTGATRFVVKGIDWRSLAFTRNPVNEDIKGYAQVVTAKAFLAMLKGGPPSFPMSLAMPMTTPRTMDELAGQHARHMKSCEHTGGLNTTVGFRKHFEACCGAHPDVADLLAHALMHHLALEGRRKETV
jgi:hypothetical protein